MDNRTRLKRIRKNSKRGRSYDRRPSGRREEENAGENRERLLLQACVSAIMIAIVLAVTAIETDFTNAIEERLKTAVQTQISMDSLSDIKNSSVAAFHTIGEKASDFMAGVKGEKEKNKKEQDGKKQIEEDKKNQGDSGQGNVYIEDGSVQDDSEIKNMQPPEVILPES